MTWTDYVNGLKKITIQEIMTIIKENLYNQEEYIYYGFQEKTNIILFGRFYNGTIVNPYVLTFDNIDNLCKELYIELKSNFPYVFNYNFEHSFSGEYDYYGYTYNDKLTIQFPNVNEKNRKWIIDQINKDRQNKNRKR